MGYASVTVQLQAILMLLWSYSRWDNEWSNSNFVGCMFSYYPLNLCCCLETHLNWDNFALLRDFTAARISSKEWTTLHTFMSRRWNGSPDTPRSFRNVQWLPPWCWCMATWLAVSQQACRSQVSRKVDTAKLLMTGTTLPCTICFSFQRKECLMDLNVLGYNLCRT